MSIADSQFCFLLGRDVIRLMWNTVDQTRLARLNMLIKRHNNTVADLNEALKWSRTDSRISQIKTKALHTQSGKARKMGDDTARYIEETLGLPEGWMDTPPTYRELLGEEDWRTKVTELMESLPDSEGQRLVRLLSALQDQPTQATGTG